MITKLMTIVVMGFVVLPIAAQEKAVGRFKAENSADAEQWQSRSRRFLAHAMKLDGVPNDPDRKIPPLNEKLIRESRQEEFVLHEIEFSASRSRRIAAIVTIPVSAEQSPKKKYPAVVCVHGHSGSRRIVYDPLSLYRGFATDLANREFITISVEVGQHKIFEEGRTLMGERLNDVIRCVDYLVSRSDVDTKRIGCAGLSLGGEMTMWLGAMDTRIQATVSSGFLTTVANMRQGHCPCWDFKEFSDNFDFADIYGLIAPRKLLCQIGRLERAPGGFPVDVAEKAMSDVQQIYSVFGKKQNAILDLHPEGHVYVKKTTVPFLVEALAK